MKNIIPTISAAVAGAAAMYFLDPDQGKRRRALVRDKVVSVSLHTGDATLAQGRRAGNRLKGWAARLASLSSRGNSDDPRTLHQRVRARLGRVVSHPKAVHAEVMDDRTVCLNGHILASELDALLGEIERVPGVARIDNRLTVHESAGNIPELQGRGRRTASSRGDGRLWRLLALTAPVAILAASVRPRVRRRSLAASLWSDRDSLPAIIGRMRQPRRHLSWLHTRG